MGEVAELLDKVAGLITAIGGLVLLGFTIRRTSRRERDDTARETVDEVLRAVDDDPDVAELLRERLNRTEDDGD